MILPYVIHIGLSQQLYSFICFGTFKLRGGFCVFLFISLAWSTIVGLFGLEDERPWSSFFLQYLWEFGFGMMIAERCMKLDTNGTYIMNIKNYCWWWLIIGAISGMGMSAFMAWNGGVLKLYNELPSLTGYISVALIIYKLGVKSINTFFEWTNSFSYELYLVHSLVFVLIGFFFETTNLTTPILLGLKFIFAIGIAYQYKIVLKIA